MQVKHFWKTVLIAGFFGLGACEQRASVDYEAEIMAQNAAFAAAYNSGDAEAVGGFYADDAVIMPPGSPVVRGPEASVALWQATMDSGLASVNLIEEEIIGLGDTAIDQGRLIAYDADGNQIATGKYLVVWKNVDGTWKFHHDIWNLDQ